MGILIQKIGIVLSTMALGAASLLSGAPVPAEAPSQSLGAAIPTAVAVFQTSLASSISTSDTAMTLVSGLTDDGTTLASSTYGFVIDEGTASQEFVLANCSNTACTGMTRGISTVNGSSSIAALKKAHRRGASVKITDHPVLITVARIVNGQELVPNVLAYDSDKAISTSSNQLIHSNYLAANYAGLASDQTITGSKTFSSTTTFSASTTFALVPVSATQPTISTQVANKAYVDGVALAGAPNADTSTKGVSEEATGSEVAAGTAVGGTGARLFVNPSTLLSSGVLSAQISTTSVVSGMFDGAYNGTTVGGPLVSSTTNGYVGRVVVPVKINASKIIVGNLDPITAGTIVISLFSADGQRKIMTATSTLSLIGTPYAKKIPFATTTIPQGTYYAAVVADSTLNSPIATYTPLQPEMGVAGSPILAGQITGITTGVMPASFSPVTGIATTSTNTTIRFRLEE